MKIDTAKLKMLLIKQGLTVKKFAEKAEISESTAYSLLKGNAASRRFDIIGKIANALVVDARELLLN